MNRIRNERWATKNPEHVKKLNREKALRHYRKNVVRVRDEMRVRANKRWARMTKEERRIQGLWNMYKITHVQYEEMHAWQDGKCLGCGDGGGKRGLFVDHCHTTKRVRGLLCHHCNAGIGHAKENIDTLTNWISYLRR